MCLGGESIRRLPNSLLVERCIRHARGKGDHAKTKLDSDLREYQFAVRMIQSVASEIKSISRECPIDWGVKRHACISGQHDKINPLGGLCDFLTDRFVLTQTGDVATLPRLFGRCGHAQTRRLDLLGAFQNRSPVYKKNGVNHETHIMDDCFPARRVRRLTR